ncbi:unnamed protein product [Penicillium palitans]
MCASRKQLADDGKKEKGRPKAVLPPGVGSSQLEPPTTVPPSEKGEISWIEGAEIRKALRFAPRGGDRPLWPEGEMTLRSAAERNVFRALPPSAGAVELGVVVVETLVIPREVSVGRSDSKPSVEDGSTERELR